MSFSTSYGCLDPLSGHYRHTHLPYRPKHPYFSSLSTRRHVGLTSQLLLQPPAILHHTTTNLNNILTARQSSTLLPLVADPQLTSYPAAAAAMFICGSSGNHRVCAPLRPLDGSGASPSCRLPRPPSARTFPLPEPRRHAPALPLSYLRRLLRRPQLHLRLVGVLAQGHASHLHKPVKNSALAAAWKLLNENPNKKLVPPYWLTEPN